MYESIPRTSTSASSFFSQEQLEQLDFQHIPRHIAIIPDGNRRWARQNQQSIAQGHRVGVNQFLTITQVARDLGVDVITFYSFSTENWSRNTLEVKALMWLMEWYLHDQRQNMVENGVRFCVIGDISPFSKNIRKAIEDTAQATAHCSEIDMVVALNYGARDEIRRAFKALLSDYEQGLVQASDISEALISSYMDTAQWPDPDLLIRTSGEQRLSNFLLWQTSYTELHTAKVLWPDYKPHHLIDAILQFQRRERRLGE